MSGEELDPGQVRDAMARSAARQRGPMDPNTIGGVPRVRSGNPQAENTSKKRKKPKNPVVEVSSKAYAESQKDWWSKTLYLLYILPLLLIFVLLALALAPLWSICRVSRPYVPETVDKETGERYRLLDNKGRRIRMNFDKYEADANLKHDIRDVTARIGKGPESGFWTFWLRRTWDMYELTRELEIMVYRQGMQVVGILSGVSILVMQVWMMVHDYTQPGVSFSPVCEAD